MCLCQAIYLSVLFSHFQVKREILVEVLTKRKTVTVNDKLILPYSLSEVSPVLRELYSDGWTL